MLDPSLAFRDIEDRLGAVRPNHIELCCFRGDPRSFAERAVREFGGLTAELIGELAIRRVGEAAGRVGGLAVEVVGEVAVGALTGGLVAALGSEDARADDRRPGIGVIAYTPSAGPVVLGHLHPLTEDQREVYLAACLGLAQRYQLSVRVNGHSYDAATSQVFVCVGDRLRRYIEPQRFPGDDVQDPHAALLALGWETSQTCGGHSWGYRRRAPPGGVRKLVRTLPFGRRLEARAFGEEPAPCHVLELGPEGIHHAQPGAAITSLALSEVFAIGLHHEGWNVREPEVGGLTLWTGQGRRVFSLPPELDPQESRATAVALERWVWGRLSELVAQWTGAAPSSA